VHVAARREAREETGLDVRIDALVNVYSYPGVIPVIIVFAATVVGGMLATDEESLEAATFPPGALPWGELAFDSTRDALRDYLAGLRHPMPAPLRCP
jgi:8-oxo-dGTP diphosphatase